MLYCIPVPGIVLLIYFARVFFFLLYPGSQGAYLMGMLPSSFLFCLIRFLDTDLSTYFSAISVDGGGQPLVDRRVCLLSFFSIYFICFLCLPHALHFDFGQLF